MISLPVMWAFRSSVRCWRHRAVLKAAPGASDNSVWRWFSSPNRSGVTGMEEILTRVVAPLPTYETREKYPPPPESNSLDFMRFYTSLDKEDKHNFLSKLSKDFGVDHKSATELAVKLLDTQLRDLATILQVEDRLRYSLTPRYKQLLNHISKVEGGVKFLVDLRADVLEIISSKGSESPHIKSEFPHMAQFSSLSPIPGFSSWLLGLLSQYRKESRGSDLLSEQEWKEVEQVTVSSSGTPSADALRKLIGTSEWLRSERLTRVLEPILMRLCAWYLYGEKRRGYALNPVANFHLQNGATMWRLNWLADTSPRGVANSCGLMVNYRYFLNETSKNSSLYLQNKVVVASEQIVGLVSQFQKNSKL
ncbi:malonyl-CoA decarboxylase, mitochondrial [Solea senegalensis]|uniref:Malonyl-CoA decarboxylase, mitochondrial n=1 Tax=Solea senegalensis TaxID=28829 RepID=A0AAV6SYN1_SOLSE|nr:malonyl-CoA decarboxylase, mitochondrial [Solea senegalensis]